MSNTTGIPQCEFIIECNHEWKYLRSIHNTHDGTDSNIYPDGTKVYRCDKCGRLKPVLPRKIFME